MDFSFVKFSRNETDFDFSSLVNENALIFFDVNGDALLMRADLPPAA
ncbi:hypothetical protein [Marinomonas sp. 2405UD68-3]